MRFHEVTPIVGKLISLGASFSFIADFLMYAGPAVDIEQAYDAWKADQYLRKYPDTAYFLWRKPVIYTWTRSMP